MSPEAAIATTEKSAKVWRYPGPHSFQDTERDRQLYYGRQREVKRFVQQLNTTQLLVLYGKSGLGKTSMLNAGVFPLLRKQNLLPLHLRLNAIEQPLLQSVYQQIEQHCQEQQIDYSQGIGASLWEHFKTSVFWRGHTRLIPVLVIDQFEEIFTLQNEQRRAALANELGDLLSGGLPTSIRKRITAGEDLEYSEKPPSVKVVISLRWEYVGRLEELFAAIPSILAQRFLLQPLSREQAELAVVTPAMQQQASFHSPPFAYPQTTLTALLDYLTGSEKTIEPYQLQLLCQHVERQIISRNHGLSSEQDLLVGEDYLGGKEGMDAILGQFYLHTVKGLQTRRAIKAARELCEWGLLTREGHRVDMPGKRIFEEYSLRETDLDYLVDQRLLRREPKLGSYSYELAHDSLAEPVLQLRRYKMSKKERYSLGAGLLITFLLILSLAMFAKYRYTETLEAKLSESMRNSVSQQLLNKQIEENQQLREELAKAKTQIEWTIGHNMQISKVLENARSTIHTDKLKKQIAKLKEFNKKSRTKLLAMTDNKSNNINASGFREPEMRFIIGSFPIGSDAKDDDTLSKNDMPRHNVAFKQGFYIGKYEVTFIEYDFFAVATGRQLPEDNGWGRNRRPVIQVNWQDARDYAAWLSKQTGKRYRLPTEAEWEVAARAGNLTAYWWGNNAGQGHANCNACGTQWDNTQTAPVGSFHANAYGLFDTAGNVDEWLQDCWQADINAPSYKISSNKNTVCEKRAIRGGSWIGNPEFMRSARRFWNYTETRYNNLGFRLARDP